MAWTIVLTKKAWGDLQRLDRETQRRIATKLESVASDPARSFQKLVDSPQYRLRVGDYRILALLDFGAERVTVLAIGHRKSIYG
ncbi:MAG: type II toxin-antitoxin system RelE/ParE family toxin [Euryarchaeota archaeon]|nr:type II toxin-antitoxin system RelE/ParE family toxin [Euryarchaeota archaeon]